MPQVAKVRKRERSASFFIEKNIGNARKPMMAGNRHRRKWRQGVEIGVDGEDSVDTAGPQEVGIRLDEIFAVAVMNGEVEVALTHKEIADSGKDLGMVSLPQFGEKDADGLHAHTLKLACDHAGLVIELLGSGPNPRARGFRDRPARSVVEDEGNR
jgi:hypothetical protein